MKLVCLVLVLLPMKNLLKDDWMQSIFSELYIQDTWNVTVWSLKVVFWKEIIAYLNGPNSVQENNIGLLNMSRLNNHLVALQPDIKRQRAQGEDVLYFHTWCIFLILTRHHWEVSWQIMHLQRNGPWTVLENLSNGHMVMPLSSFMPSKATMKRNIFYQMGC